MNHKKNHDHRILFILKQRCEYYGSDRHPHHKPAFSSGLYNSATFAAEMLREHGYETKVVEVVDGNGIDREVYLYRPSTVILEALWVTPEKLRELLPLHRKVRWIVRLHSEMSFLSLEGIAIEWIREYWKIPNVFVAANTVDAQDDLYLIRYTDGAKARLMLLPTYYPNVKYSRKKLDDNNVRIICPGAIRPLKNQFVQALAAIRYADELGKNLEFYINTTRSEQGGDSVWKNIQNLFRGTWHTLVGIDWLDHDDFIDLCRGMDAGLQCSFSESFNICAADLVSCGVPVVTSNQVRWTSRFAHADPTSSRDIAQTLKIAVDFDFAINPLNRHGLKEYGKRAEDHWLDELSH